MPKPGVRRDFARPTLGVPRVANRQENLTCGLPAKMMYVDATWAAWSLGSPCLRLESIVFRAFFAKKAASSVRFGANAIAGVRGPGASGGSVARRLLHEPLEPRMTLAAGPLLITEFMAVNDIGLTDDNGDRSDWIEIHNPTGAAVNLDGWYLTDDDDALTKWRCPSTDDRGGRLFAGLRLGQGPRQSRRAAAHELQTRRRRRVPRAGAARRRDDRPRVRPGVRGASGSTFPTALRAPARRVQRRSLRFRLPERRTGSVRRRCPGRWRSPGPAERSSSRLC